MGKKVLVTGAAGFIGFHLSKRLCAEGFQVIGVDNLNPYYDPNLKQARLDVLLSEDNFSFVQCDIGDRSGLPKVFSDNSINYVVNLAAQAGVRYSLTNPFAYTESNITGFLNVLECCRHSEVEHLIYASSSSVYGGNTSMPFSVNQNVDHPVSLYAATKKSNELMAHTYSHLYKIPTTGLRFFTVYGPWGRPDMALFLFTKSILNNEPIKVFNNGNMKRDFTYVDDIVEGLVRLLPKPPCSDPNWNSDEPSPETSNAPYKIYNIGNNNPVGLMEFIKAIEIALGKEAIKEYLPLQDGDVPHTFANVDGLMDVVNFKPTTNIQHGVSKFVSWYEEYYL
ncbi:MAG: NAD-dependent epimerase [Cyclobacteriaceae bacterium]